MTRSMTLPELRGIGVPTLAIAAVLAAGACAGAPGSGSPGAGSSGSPGTSPRPSVPVPTGTPSFGRISGRVTASPTCPVERNPPDPSCAPRAISGAVLVFQDAAGHQLLRITSGSDGTFSTSVAPGKIRIVPQPVAGLLGTAQPVDLTVTAGATIADVVIDYDTGIR